MPDGFRVQLFAGEPDVVQPVSFALDDRGRLWVAEALAYPNWKPEGNDRVIILEDSDGDGQSDKRTVFYDKLNYVTGIEVGFGGVWIVSPPSLLFIPDRDANDKPDGPPTVLLDGFGREGVHNIVNGFTWGPDGWLYGGHGGTSYSRLGKPGTPDGRRQHFDGGVWRYHPTRHEFEGVAEGTTNPWGVAFDDYGQASISNSVTPHLYHVIPGAHFERRRHSELSKYAYGRIDTIADHRHWVGESWDKSRGGTPQQIAAGGGHAHCGVMVYLGDSFPDRYRGVVFMNNIHGNRTNTDLLERKGSGYVAHHGPDFLVAGDPRFRGIGLRYGPDGSVFVSDWYETGECHARNPDRTNGRIYKVSYGEQNRATVDLDALSNEELVKLQLHRNDWFVQHARRILQERAAAGQDLSGVHKSLRKLLDEEPDVTRRLRALWALHVIGGIDQRLITELLESDEEYLRAWAVQFELEDRHASSEVLRKLAELAQSDASPVVQLYIASGLQRLPLADRWEIAQKLLARPEFNDDHNLPLMIWYAVEPLVAADKPRALSLIAKCRLPVVRQYIARRAAEKE